MLWNKNHWLTKKTEVNIRRIDLNTRDLWFASYRCEFCRTISSTYSSRLSTEWEVREYWFYIHYIHTPCGMSCFICVRCHTNTLSKCVRCWEFDEHAVSSSFSNVFVITSVVWLVVQRLVVFKSCGIQNVIKYKSNKRLCMWLAILNWWYGGNFVCVFLLF